MTYNPMSHTFLYMFETTFFVWVSPGTAHHWNNFNGLA
jgi:hypothetical protein